MLVIADTSPLNYLILVDAIELLPRLYPQIILNGENYSCKIHTQALMFAQLGR
jgi:predicted nucleic acid-binding protein